MNALALILAASVSCHIDFARLFPTFEKQRSDYEAAVRAVEARRGGAHLMDAYNAALVAFARLDACLYLRYAEDTRQVDLLHEEEALEADFAKRTAFLAKRSRLTLGQTEVVDTLTPALTGWPAELYDMLVAKNDRSRDLYAFALFGLVRAREQTAKLRGFSDAPSEAYANAQLTRADARRLLDAVAEAAPVYAAFQQRRSAAPAITAKPSYSFEEARAVILNALTPLGGAYIDQMSALLDPDNGRIDIGGGDHRLRGGFSKGFPGMTSVFFMSGFTGTYNDVRVMTHEGTHAVERQMQGRAHVKPVDASGPKFIMEALAITAELTLAKSLYERTTDPLLRRFFLDQLLTSKGITILFRTAAEADLEERIYDRFERGEIRGADDLDSLTVAIFARYGMTVPPDEWTRIPLLFEDPFYDINYTWADAVALQLFAKARSDPAAFAASYTRAMASGFDVPPAAWLRRELDVSLTDPRIVTHAIEALQPYIDAY